MVIYAVLVIYYLNGLIGYKFLIEYERKKMKNDRFKEENDTRTTTIGYQIGILNGDLKKKDFMMLTVLIMSIQEIYLYKG